MSDIDVDFEQRLREMLHRRAADIEGHSEAPDIRQVVPDDDGRWLRQPWVLACAAGVACVAIGLIAALASGDRNRVEASDPVSVQSTTVGLAEEVDDEESADDELASDAEEGVVSERALTLPPESHMMAAIAGLPDLADLSGAFLLRSDLRSSDPVLLAERYLDVNWGFAPELTLMETIDDLAAVRWETADSGAGYVLVAVGDRPQGSGVVAVVADDITVTAAERSVLDFKAEVQEASSGLIAADVLDLDRQVVASTPSPETYSDSRGRVFGTAGSSTDGTLSVDVEIVSAPIIVRIQTLSEETDAGYEAGAVTEFVVRSPGFAAACGAEAPLTIDVGAALGPLAPGPAPDSPNNALTGQQVWHYRGESASVEIRWPADPYVGDRADTQIWWTESVGGTDGMVAADVATVIDSPAEGACSTVQLSLFGRANVVEWWTGALIGQRGAGVPLQLASLAPDPVSQNEPSGDELSGGDALVADEVQVVEEFPVVPQAGTCDGLPDAPPRSGQGDGTQYEAAELALEALVVGLLPDGSALPQSGYTAYRSSSTDKRIVFALPSGHGAGALAVIEVLESDGRWTVDTWTVAAC